MLKLRILNEGNVDILSLLLHPSRRQQCKYRTLDGAHFIPKLLAIAVTSPCRVSDSGDMGRLYCSQDCLMRQLQKAVAHYWVPSGMLADLRAFGELQQFVCGCVKSQQSVGRTGDLRDACFRVIHSSCEDLPSNLGQAQERILVLQCFLG